MPIYRKPDYDDDGEEEGKMRHSKIYQAPETLLGKGGPPIDVYAYSIILTEIATRNDPYGVSNLIFTVNISINQYIIIRPLLDDGDRIKDGGGRDLN